MKNVLLCILIDFVFVNCKKAQPSRREPSRLMVYFIMTTNWVVNPAYIM
jgi:hypothetical protein